MNYFQALISPDGLRGIFSILLIATILTLFEIIFFFVKIAPDVGSSANNAVGGLSNTTVDGLEAIMVMNFGSKFNHTDAMIAKDNHGARIINTLANREKLIIGKINGYTKTTGVVIMVLLCVLLAYIYMALKNKTKLSGEGVQLGTASWTALMTVGILISFQIFFYFFSQQYSYPGSEGDNELLSTVLKAIDVPESSAKSSAESSAESSAKSSAKSSTDTESE